MKVSEIQTKKELFNHDQRLRKLEKNGGQAYEDLKDTVDKNQSAMEEAVGRIDILEANSLTVDSAVIRELQAQSLAVTGNIKAITAEIEAVKTDYVKTEDLEADYTTTTDLKATYATIGALNAAKGDIVILQTQKLDAETARVTYATITNLNAAVGRISKLETDSLTADSATIKNLQTKDAEIETLVAGKATIADLDAAKARISDIEADYITTGQLNAVEGKIETLTAKAITTETLSAEVASLGYITADSLTVIRADIDKIKVDKLDSNLAKATYATIDNLSAVSAEVDDLLASAITTGNLSAQVAKLGYATVTSLNATNIQVSNLSADVAEFEKATAEDFSAVNGEIDNIKADYVKTSTLEADYTTTKSLQATYATIAGLNASNAEINTLKTGKLDTETAEATYATITSLNAANAEIGSLKTIKLDVNTAAATYATIVNLNAAVGRISTLETNSLTAESAVITNLQSGLAQLDTLIFGSASGTSIHSSFANAVIAQLGNAQIKSAMIETLSADKITSGSINTDNVTIASADGGMVISDNTIQIKDGTSVRVQIGKDASGNYSVVICDSAGKVMFNTNGITADAIKNAIIRNDMVADNANISAGKLDIDSLFTVINEDGSHTIKSTQIYMDDVEQTLDVAYKTATTAVSNLYETVGTQGTRISVLQGQITSKIWQQDINTAKNELNGSITTLSTQYSTLNQTVGGLSSTVGTHTTQIAGKADSSTVTQVSNKVSTLEQNLTGFQTTVSNTYAPKATVNKAVKEVHRYYAPGGGGEVILEECTPEYTMDGDYLDYAINIVGGMTYTVYWNGVPYTCVALTLSQEGITGTVLGNSGALLGGESTDEPFVIATVPAQGGTLFMDLTGAHVQTVSIISGTGDTLEKPTTYPPGGLWSETEPTSGGVSTTLCTVYVDGTFSYSDISVNTAGEVAAGAANAAGTAAGTAISALFAAEDAYSLADQANSIANTANNNANTAKNQVTQLATRVTQTESSITSQASSISSLGTRISTVEQTASGLTISLQTTNSNLEKNYQKTVSKGEQLVTNGNGLMGDNTNFSQFVFNGAVANNSPGSFTKAAGSAGTYTTDEYFPVNPANEYTFSLDAKSANGVGRLYSMLMFYDVDKKEINAGTHIHNAASTTTLARDLKAGDTTIYLTSAAGWSTTYAYGFYMTVWNYKNSFGYTYPSGTYSRTRLTLPKNGNYLNSANLNKTANTITLATAYSGATIPAGTSVSQGGDGATYKYFPCSNTLIPTTWKSYSGKITGIDYSGGNKAAMFPPGTAYARIGFLWNYQGSGNGEQLWVTNLSVTDTTAATAAQTAANSAQSTANTAVQNAATAQNTANAARTEASNAAKTATNYLNFSSAGLVVGDMTSSSLGKNVLIYTGGVNIRNGSTVLASFTESKIQLGVNTPSSVIELCGSSGVIRMDKDYNGIDVLRFKAPNISVTANPETGAAVASLDARSASSAQASIHAGLENSGANDASVVAETTSGGSPTVIIGVNSVGNISLITVLPSKIILSSNTISVLGDIALSAASQATSKAIKWAAINSKNPYIGYATDQTDGTFVVASLLGTNYGSGLAIGGGSGNLLYKANVVLHAGNYTSYAATAGHTHSNYALTGHTHNYAGASSAGGAATKAISDQNGRQIDRIYCSMIPFGTTVPANANLNTVTYMKVGNYFCSANATVATLTNCPSTSAFMMQVYTPLSTTIDNESTGTWVYRLRKLMTYTGDEYIQYCYVGATAGTWSYGAWKKVVKSEDLSSYAPKSHNHDNEGLSPRAIELKGASGHGGYIDFHYGGSTADYTTRLIEVGAGVLTINDKKVMTARNMVGVYSVTLTFTNGIATYQNSAIKGNSVVFVQRRAASAGTSKSFTTSSAAGSVTITSDNLSGTIDVNILIINN